MNYSKLNTIFGWVAFAIAFVTYLLTVAPTASFWDCGEFISCANELQVPHPPGPPIYLLLGRFFALFAPDVTTVAYMVNLVSVLSGAFTVLFTFWIITALAKKIVSPDGEPAKDQSILIMFAGMVGALACAFSDSFWFNAVEAEVYALSSLCTAAVVWLILKWEVRADEPHHLRWIVLIAFVVGLSIGVHLLNLLAIPALAYIFYVRKYEFTWGGLIVTLGASIVILALVQYGIIQYSIEFIWMFERNLVGLIRWDGADGGSGMGFPMGTGVWVFSLLLFGILGFVIFKTHKAGVLKLGSIEIPYSGINTISLSTLVILIGYSSYMMIAIRANTDAPINENDPGNVVSMLSYMKREQYGDRPLFSGPLYNNVSRGKQVQERKNFVVLKDENWLPIEDGEYTLKGGGKLKVKKGRPSGAPIKKGATLEDGTRLRIDKKTNAVESFRTTKKYVWDGYRAGYEYDSRYKKLFPRMYSSSHYQYPKNLYGYRRFVSRIPDPKNPSMDRPTSGEDLRYFFEYQLNHMYIRYFMWNFAGREGDKQDDTWESGLKFWNTSKMPEAVSSDPGKNHYYMLPLLLGLFGLVWHGFSKTKDWGAIMLLFFFTGIAIIIYLNQTPSQPRERDYSYVGSFQTFAIWIGLGIIGLWELLKPVLRGSAHWVVGIAGLLMAPAIMAKENWDDHTRAVRYVAPDSAYNLLNSCAENGILFTNGDNDTFPLWYIQEVEGVRTDVRVVNLSLLNTDWYIDQMKKQANLSAPLPISIGESQYRGEKNAIVGFPKGQKITLEVDSACVVQNGTVPVRFADKVFKSGLSWVPRTRGGANSYILKQDYLIIDILRTNAKNCWERPIYFSSTIPPSSYINLTPYFVVEGLAYRVVPAELPENPDPYQQGLMDLDSSYKKLTQTFRYRELDNNSLYLDEHIRRTIIGNLRSTFYRTANGYITQGEVYENRKKNEEAQIKVLQTTDGDPALIDSLQQRVASYTGKIEQSKLRAREILDLHDEKIPYDNIAMEPVLQLFMGNAYFRLGDAPKAIEYYDYIDKLVRETLIYHEEIDEPFKYQDRYIGALDMLARYYDQVGAPEKGLVGARLLYSITLEPRHEQLLKALEARIGQE